MKRHFLFLVVIITCGILNAQEVYHFRTNHPQGFSIESSTASGLSLHYSVSEIGIANINSGEASGKEIIMKGSFGSFAEGLPNLPVQNRYIAIPNGATVSVEIKENGCQTLNDIDLLPATPPQEDGDFNLPKPRKNMDVFGKDANFPSENAVIAQTTQIRGLDVVLLSVSPFRYNPIRKTLDVVYDMDIEVHFEGGNSQFGEARYRNPDWDHILRNLVINSDMLPEANYYDYLNQALRDGEEGADYLIIAPDDDSIVAWANVLKDFRTKQGILTKVVTTTECGGNTPEHIKSYIQNAYENWAIPPAALLIFGAYYDTIYTNHTVPNVGIPGFSLEFIHYVYDDGQYQDYDYFSDNLYADMNNDTIPDIAISRMPALTLEEYQTQVEKLINYETAPPTTPLYYDHPVITSTYAYNKWFMITSQSANGFFLNKLDKHPTNLYSIYFEHLSEHPNPPDSAWSTAQYTDDAVNYFGPNGENYIPQYIGALDNWIYYTETDSLINAMNKGSFLTLFRSHSAAGFWASQNFMTTDIPKLNNTDPTFILSIGCNTANYLKHVDAILYGFCNARIGALGGIGAVTVTRSQFNDIFTWGFLDYIWPEFMSTLGNTNNPEFARPAYAFVAGKLFLNQHAFIPNWWPDFITDTHNVLHYLGETYLSLNTERPQKIALDASLFHSENQQEYNFTAEEGATVCISKDNEMIMVMQGTGQIQSARLPKMAVGEQFTLTATLQNHIRYQKNVTIIPANQPFVNMREATVDDQDGNGQLDYGEYAWISLKLQNSGEVTSENAEVSLYCDSPYVEILQETAHYPRLEPYETHTLEDAFRIKLSDDVPDQTQLHFEVVFHEGESMHLDHFETKAHAPVIAIQPTFSITDAEGRPSTHILTEGESYLSFTVSNRGTSKSQTINAEFDIKAPFVTTGGTLTDALEPHENRNISLPIIADGSESAGAWLKSHLQIQHLDTIYSIDTLLQYGGIFEDFETDSLNPLLSWTNTTSTSNCPWNYCDDDAYTGERCFMGIKEGNKTPALGAQNTYVLSHPCKISFYYKLGSYGELRLNYNLFDYFYYGFSPSEDWQYGECLSSSLPKRTKWWRIFQNSDEPVIGKLDNICFPPPHRTIVYAGDEMISCQENAVKLSNAYAYDCNSLYWVTEGDGHFEEETMENPTYFPGIQDITNGEVILTLHAISASDTISCATKIHFVDGINLGSIVGENVVNKYQNQISHYSIEDQAGINYVWQLEPAEAGTIYSHGNAIDIAWNLYEGDMEVTLSVTADNGCDVEPISKTISLIGTGTAEWHSFDFDLFPNPTDGKVNLFVGETMQGKIVIEVYNLLGERMMTKDLHHLQKGETLCLDLNHLVSGLYIIKLNTENGSCTKKVSLW